MDRNKLFTNTFAIVVLALICNALWGSAFPCIKLGYEWFNVETTPDKILFAGMRFAIAGMLVIIFNSILHKRFITPESLSDWKRVFILCMFQTVLQYLFFYIGLSNTSGVKASIVEGSNVFVSIIIAALVPTSFFGKKDKLSLRVILGCLIGFAGVVIVNLKPEGLDAAFKLTGEGFVFISTFAYGFSTVLIKKYAIQSDTVMLSGWQFFTGGLIMVVIGVFAGGQIHTVTCKGIEMLMYLALISAVAYTLWGILLKYNPVSKIAVFGFSNPVFGVILSAILLGEGSVLNIKCIMALILVCAGIYLVNKGDANRKQV